MSIMLGKYYFKGPYSSLNELENKPGLYAVHCQEEERKILDIGEAAMIRDRIKTHERMKCWLRWSEDQGIAVSAYYTKHWTQTNRMKAVNKLRDKYSPPCGKKIDGKLFLTRDD
ncbi:MAG: hypothetical protein ACOCQ1_00715 [Halanaerobiaceae bacterium]